jgi:hypothetical protein
MAAVEDPWPTATTVDAVAAPDEVLRAALAARFPNCLPQMKPRCT